MQVKIIPILKDNYVFVLFDLNLKEAIVVDPGSSDVVINFLNQNNLKLKAILLTHQHDDHIAGVFALKDKYNCDVFASKKVQNELKIKCEIVNEGDQIKIGESEISVMNVEGHTLDHLAYDFKSQKMLFVGDALFGMGCGRIFEGDFEMTFSSLKKIKNLAPEYQVYCAHEYTEANIKFAEKIISENSAPLGLTTEVLERYRIRYHESMKTEGRSIPLSLKLELLTNPFLLSETLEQFSKLRVMRNSFRA